MTQLLDCALINAVLAVPLALLAVLGSLTRRPALAHALWLLVLLRLFAPPLWQPSLPPWLSRPVPSEPSSPVRAESGGGPAGTAGHAVEALPDAAESPAVLATVEWSSAPAAQPSVTTPRPWRPVVGTVWLVGTAVCLGAAVRRVIAFRRWLRQATPAPTAWQHTSDRLARRLGLRRGPSVWLVPGPVAPLLWAGFGPPRLLLPAGLVLRLDGARRAALVAHELAHLRRGDGWVRWLELAATAAYWWHPLVWWARRGLRAAEEQCCDAWVVWALPGARRAYASALVDTVDFLSEVRPLLPPLASGLGEVRHLRRRVVMIMRGSVPRRLSRLGLLAGLALGAVLLSISPGRSQDGPDDRPAPKAEPKGRPGARGDDRPRPEGRRADEAQRLREEIRELRNALRRAEDRLAELEDRPRPRNEARGRANPNELAREELDKQLMTLRFERQALMSTLGENHPAVKLKDDQIKLVEQLYGQHQPGPRGPAPQPPPPPGVPGAAGGALPPPPPGAPSEAPRGLPGGPRPSRGANGPDPAARMRDLEREVAELRREMAELRRELRRPPERRDATPPPPE